MDDLQGAPARIGKYELLRKIGAGGMAELYLCRRTGIGGFAKQVVVKVIHPDHIGNEEFVQMFLDEARVSASLNHPNLVHVYEIDQVNQLPYLAMEHVDGPSLDALAKRAFRAGRVELAHFCTLLAGAARGLHHAHHATDPDGRPMNLVHRDISPQNILVTQLGAAKVIDFGVARADNRLVKTEVGAVKGKLGYMAPEQLKTEPYDHRVDVYALGVCLYRLTTGKSPFPTKQDELIRFRLRELPPPPPSAVRPDYPQDLEAIVLKTMADDPDERYADAEQLAVDLQAWAEAHGSSEAAVAAWLRELFPGGADEWTSGKNQRTTGSTSLRRLLTGDDLSAEVTAQTAPGTSRNMVAVWGALALGLLLVGAGVAWVVSQQRELAAQLEGARTLEAGSDDEAVLAYIEEAEAQLSAGELRPAGDLLEAARAGAPRDPQLVVRLARLERGIERARSLAEAEGHLAREELAEATGAVRGILDVDPTDADAVAILEKVRALQAPPELAVVEEPSSAAPTGRRRPEPALGALSIDSDPSGWVFVDDLPVGQTPLSSHPLTPGAHLVHVRHEGYRSAELNVEVTADKTAERTVTLEPLPEPEPVVAAVAEPEPIAPPPPAPEPEPAPAPTLRTVAASLPEHMLIRNISEVRAVLLSVEKELVASGVDPDVADGVTSPLAQALVDAYNPGTAMELYPRAMHTYVAEKVAAGGSKRMIGRDLRTAHLTGRLAP